VIAVNNGLALTPAMGYNTWNDLRCDNVTAENIRLVADRIAEINQNHLANSAHKYEYINIDDCWSFKQRSDSGELLPDPKNFPDGMLKLSQYVHSKGLKLGIYTDRGNRTCAGYPASFGYEILDANTFAAWEIDYVKEDSCNATEDPEEAMDQYRFFGKSLNKTDRGIYFSLCGWNKWYAPKGAEYANSWRIFGDVNEWSELYGAMRVNSELYKFAKIGGWNDPDMLLGSTPGAAKIFTPRQSRTQFTLWAMMHAPLLLGSNIRQLSDFDLETYTNADVIAIDQDPLGIQGRILWEDCHEDKVRSGNDSSWSWSWVRLKIKMKCLLTPSLCDGRHGIPSVCTQVWGKALKDDSFALAMINFGVLDTGISCKKACIENLQKFFKLTLSDTQRYLVTNLWTGKENTITNIVSKPSLASPVLGGNGDQAVFRVRKKTPTLIVHTGVRTVPVVEDVSSLEILTE